MTTEQTDDEMDDDEEMDDAPNDPSSSSTSKKLSNKSKKKKAREEKMAQAREKQEAKAKAKGKAKAEADPYVETLHPKPPKQPKYDDIGINELTDKKAEKDYDNRRSHWSRQRVGYLKDQLLLRGHRFTHESLVSHSDLLNTLRYDYHI